MRCEKRRSAVTQKGDQTKALILETALEMFRENGYEQTTMRAIAEKANLSLGNAYYYFPSKEYLIQAFYRRTHEQHRRRICTCFRKRAHVESTLAHLDADEDQDNLSRITSLRVRFSKLRLTRKVH